VLEATSIVTGLHGRYATALYELAADNSAVPTVENDLHELKRAIDSSTDFKRLIKSPVFSRESQWKALDAITTRMRLSDLTRRFLGVVTNNRRLFALLNIIEDYFKLAAHFRGEIASTVTSARPLNSAQVNSIKATLKSALGQTINLSQSVDADLLGGLIVRVGSVMVDSSIRTQLQKLQVAMREVN
jgi:F-type H+-transporting ATPase subunit delta